MCTISYREETLTGRLMTLSESERDSCLRLGPKTWALNAMLPLPIYDIPCKPNHIST